MRRATGDEHLVLAPLVRFVRCRELFRGNQADIALAELLEPLRDARDAIGQAGERRPEIRFGGVVVKREHDVADAVELGAHHRARHDHCGIDHDEPGRVGPDVFGLLREDRFALADGGERIPLILGLDHHPVDFKGFAAAIIDPAGRAAGYVRTASFPGDVDENRPARIAEDFAEQIAKRAIHGRLLPLPGSTDQADGLRETYRHRSR